MKVLIFIITIALSTLLTSCATSTVKSFSIEGTSYETQKIKVNFKNNKHTVLVFVSSKCPCSNSHNSILQQMNHNFKKVKFVGIHSNFNEDYKFSAKYFKEARLGFPVIRDGNSLIAKKLGAVKTPHAFIFDGKGDIIYNGAITSSSIAKSGSDNYLENALNDIKMGKLPRKAKRKTLGCYIAIKE